jgi:hypothetical protein
LRNPQPGSSCSTGREGSKYGIDDFVEIKYVRMGGID